MSAYETSKYITHLCPFSEISTNCSLHNHPGILDINAGTKNLNEFEFPAKIRHFKDDYSEKLTKISERNRASYAEVQGKNNAYLTFWLKISFKIKASTRIEKNTTILSNRTR